MSHITLNTQQARILAAASDPVEIRDEQGNLLGYVSRRTRDEEIALARQRLESNGPWVSTNEVLEHLKSLESR